MTSVEFINQYRPYIEFAYLISGPAMLMSIIIGMMQLRELRKESRVKIERESIKLSIEVLAKTNEQIINFRSATLESERDSEMIPFLGSYDANFLIDREANKAWLEKFDSDECIDLYNNSMFLFNCIEGLAHYLNSGVIDDEFCYKLESSSILGLIDECGKYMAAHVTLQSEVYSEAITLIQRWRGMQNKSLIHEKKSALAKEEENVKNIQPISVLGKKPQR